MTVRYPLRTPDGPISKLRTKRLLQVAAGMGDCKRFYHQYIYLVRAGFVVWALGHAYLTLEGVNELDRLERIS